MSEFQKIKEKRGLKRFLGSDLGTMYFNPNVLPQNDVIVRHFDSKLQYKHLASYVQLYNEIVEFMNDSSLVKFVEIFPLIEVGEDYVSRPFHSYDFATSDYFDEEVGDDFIPRELMDEIRKHVEALQLKTESAKQQLVMKVIYNSLVAPSNKTYFNNSSNKMIVVEPTIKVEDIIEWDQLVNGKVK